VSNIFKLLFIMFIMLDIAIIEKYCDFNCGLKMWETRFSGNGTNAR
jgi:hypothetical protein